MKNKDIHTTLPYLARSSIYAKQKPFATDFIPKVSNATRTNHVFDFIDISVTDAQPIRDTFTLQDNGFCFLISDTVLTSDNAGDPTFVEENYYPEVESALYRAFPEYARLECLDHQVNHTQEVVRLSETIIGPPPKPPLPNATRRHRETRTARRPPPHRFQHSGLLVGDAAFLSQPREVL